MEEQKKIYKAIVAVMGEIGAIKKERRNEQQHFLFRGIDQVMNTMKPLLAKHGIFIVPEVIDKQREERVTKGGSGLMYSILTIRYHFIADDGSEVTAVVVGEGMDSGDKASNKAMAVAFKYACFQVFCIPTEEMVLSDPDSETPEASMNAELSAVLGRLGDAKSIDDLNTLWSTLEPSEQNDATIRGMFTRAKNKIKQQTK